MQEHQTLPGLGPIQKENVRLPDDNGNQQEFIERATGRFEDLGDFAVRTIEACIRQGLQLQLQSIDVAFRRTNDGHRVFNSVILGPTRITQVRLKYVRNPTRQLTAPPWCRLTCKRLKTIVINWRPWGLKSINFRRKPINFRRKRHFWKKWGHFGNPAAGRVLSLRCFLWAQLLLWVWRWPQRASTESAAGQIQTPRY